MNALSFSIYEQIFSERLSSFYFIRCDRFKVKSLSGFNKEVHFIPKFWSNSVERFIQNAGEKDFKESCDMYADAVRHLLSLKVSDYEYSLDGGRFVFKSDSCEIEAHVFADRSDLNYYFHEIRFMPRNFLQHEIVEELLYVLGGFYELEFLFTETIDVRNAIAAIEKNEAVSGVAISYPADAEFATLCFSDSERLIRLYPDRGKVKFGSSTDLHLFLAGFGDILF